MIARTKTSWWTMLFVWRGSILHRIVPQLGIVLSLSMFAVWKEGTLFQHKVPLNATPFTLVGVSLALFLGFRNSASYDRWWEGRKFWGALVNVTRSLTRQAVTYVGNRDQAREFVDLLVAFTYAMRDQLRGESSGRLPGLLPAGLAPEVLQSRYKPLVILRMLSEWVVERYHEGSIGEVTLSSFDSNLNELANILGGCERIAGTPLPFSYSVTIHQTVYLYCALLPFGLVDAIGWMTPAISVFVAYSFMALDALAAELEHPFGSDDNDLPLNAISRTIELSVREIFGEPLIGEAPLQPENFLLL